ncbi:hypothetical protein [uncultured Hymenobacter sp.]|uniref:hypothetical protein n=1 Tax=uncultured Hymenobacter sp. TaxID=170016 RepID=UPI0035C9437A
MLEIWLAEAQADHARYLPDLRQVEQLLKTNPTDPALQQRHQMIQWYVSSLAEGIDILQNMISTNGTPRK